MNLGGPINNLENQSFYWGCDNSYYGKQTLMQDTYTVITIDDDLMQMLLDNYCLWLNSGVEDVCQPAVIPESSIHSNEIASSSSVKSKNKKVRMLQTFNLDDQCDRLETLLNQLKYGVEIISGKAKSRRSSDNNPNRSIYIGVSKNGPNWQALITVHKRKTYIGTYATQIEAAKAFDRYSILLNNLTAKTNFSYTKDDLIGIVSEYKKQTIKN